MKGSEAMTLLDVAVLSTDHHWHPWLFPLIPLFWLLALFLLFRFVCWPGGWRGRRDHTRSAREILAERYARGQISEEEYRTRRAGLAS
jgi:putative membrane protein